MRINLRNAIAAAMFFSMPIGIFAQAPTLGSTVNFVLFSSDGAVTNTGNSHLTGNVGTNGGSSTGFGNVNGGMHDGDGTSAQASADLLVAYNQLNATTATLFPASLLGNGQTLTAGVYSIGSSATLTGNLILNGQGNANAVFIFKIQGSFSTGAASKVKLINGALACNIFWKVEGLVSMATASTMRGTIIANNAAINMNINDTLEGRALSTTGAITVNGALAYTSIGCNSVILTGPAAPALASAECYTIFSSSGSVTNTGITHVTGDVGTNSGLTTGFDTLLVTGKVHPTPDVSTAQCAADLHSVYTYLNNLAYDIQLLYPAQFGNNLVLTPHTYLLNAATVLTDTVFLNAEGDSNAVFVLKINGAFSTSTYSCVQLINGAQAKNVFWKIEGAVTINNYSTFCGTIVCNNGALSAINTGVTIHGRAFTTTGAINTSAIVAIMPPGCTSGAPDVATPPTSQSACLGTASSFAVIAHGTGLTYQWRKGTTNLVNGGNITGATSAILTISPVSNTDAATDYNVIVTGTYAPADTTTNAALTVNTAPAVITAPVSQTACAGGAASFSITATGTGLTYQWRKANLNLASGANIQGAITNVLTINPVSASDTSSAYNVITTGVCAPSDTSGNVALGLCNTTTIHDLAAGINLVTVYPNPFTSSIQLVVNNMAAINHCRFLLYNVAGVQLITVTVQNQNNTIETGKLPAGIYFYQIVNDRNVIQSGSLVAQ